MLEVTVTLDNAGNVTAFEASGHTNYASAGEDIVCAGASAVVQSAVRGCTEILGITAGTEKEDGYLYFTLPADIDDNKFRDAQILLKTMLLALKEISSTYPGKINIIVT